MNKRANPFTEFDRICRTLFGGTAYARGGIYTCYSKVIDESTILYGIEKLSEFYKKYIEQGVEKISLVKYREKWWGFKREVLDNISLTPYGYITEIYRKTLYSRIIPQTREPTEEEIHIGNSIGKITVAHEYLPRTGILVIHSRGVVNTPPPDMDKLMDIYRELNMKIREKIHEHIQKLVMKQAK